MYHTQTYYFLPMFPCEYIPSPISASIPTTQLFITSCSHELSSVLPLHVAAQLKLNSKCNGAQELPYTQSQSIFPSAKPPNSPPLCDNFSCEHSHTMHPSVLAPATTSFSKRRTSRNNSNPSYSPTKISPPGSCPPHSS